MEANAPVSPQVSPSPTTAIETTLLIPTTEFTTQTPTTIPYTTLECFKVTIIYENIFRYSRDTDEDGIGDMQGVTESLDEIEPLGVYTILLMPIHPSPSQHGFGVIDCFGMNPDYCDYRCEPMGWYAGQKGAWLSANN